MVFKVPFAKNTIAITFDDGPHPLQTPVILDVLARHNTKATFFMTGANIRRNKDLLRTVTSGGHEIANHTNNHPNGFFANRSMIFDEIATTKKLIEDTTGIPNIFFRPPYGIFTPAMLSTCKALDLSIILWSINSFDYKCRGESQIASRVIDRVKSGDICLFHDCHFRDITRIYSQTVNAMKTILPYTVSKGLKGVTVGELVADLKKTL